MISLDLRSLLSSSTTSQFISIITEFLYQTLDKDDEVWAVTLDISRLFDRVWHTGLLCKLKSYSVSGLILILIQLFLTNCVMMVVVNGRASCSFHIKAGAFQGYILGRKSSFIFINHFPISSQLDIYVGDIRIYSCLSGRSNNVTQATDLENYLHPLFNCAKEFLLNLNASKT